MTRLRIDLNADLGEGTLTEELLMAHVTSANVACGGHVGDADTMAASLRLARLHGVVVGAHPSLPDREHFGRRERPTTPDEAYTFVLHQTRDLLGVAARVGVTVAHVKPHGALYNMAARDAALARAVAEGARDAGVPALYGLAGSVLLSAATAVGLRAVPEAFADRAYRADGSLVPRGQPHALHPPGEAVRQAVGIAARGEVITPSGEVLRLRAETICLHGDGDHAEDLARRVRAALAAADVDVRAP